MTCVVAIRNNERIVLHLDEEKAIQFLRENGVTVRHEPVAYMTPSFISAEAFAFGEHANRGYVSCQEKLSISEAVDRVIRQHESCRREDEKWIKTGSYALQQMLKSEIK